MLFLILFACSHYFRIMDNNKKKIIRITTVPVSLLILLKGQLKFMNQYYNIIGVSSNGKDLNDVNNNEGIHTYAIKMTRSITPFKDLLAVFSLYHFLKKENPFIVHTHTPKAGIIGMLAAKMAGIPNRLHTVAGLPLLEVQGLKRKLLDLVEKVTYKCSTKVFPNSFGLYNIIVQNNYVSSSKLKVLGYGSSNGIDTEYFNSNLIDDTSKNELREKLGFTKDDVILLYVGRIVKDKGINELISAFCKLSKIKNNCKLLLVGFYETKLSPLNKETLYEIQTNKHISAIGWKNDVRPYFTISKSLVFPTYREGFPNVVLQAGSMDLPSIVTNINGCNEIIKDGFNGIIIPPKNEVVLLDAMIRIIENPKKTLKMSKNARGHIIKHFQQEYIWNEILKEYKSLEH